MKRFVSLLAALVLLAGLAACGGTPSGAEPPGPESAPVQQGRYVETDITPPGLLHYISDVITEGEAITVLSYTPAYMAEPGVDTYMLHHSPDSGTTWQETSLAWLEELRAAAQAGGEEAGWQASLWSLRLMYGGGLVFVMNTDGEGAPGQQAYLATAEGTTRPLRLDVLDEIEALPNARPHFGGLVPLPGGTLLASVSASTLDEETGTYVYGGGFAEQSGIFSIETGALLAEMPVTIDTVVGDDYVVASSPDGSLVAYDTATGERLARATVILDNMAVMKAMLPDGDCVYLGTEGLYRMDVGDIEPALILDAPHYSFGSPVMNLTTLNALGSDRLVMGVIAQSGLSRLKLCTWDETAPAATQSLTVFALRESDTLRQAMFLLGIRHPEVEITLEYYYDSKGNPLDESKTRDDILRDLSLRVLAGDGPDVLILDDLPLESYIENGFLEDISGVVEGSGMMPQIVAALTTSQGGLYAVPGRFAVPLLFTAEAETAQRLSTLEGLATAAWAGGEVPVLRFGNLNDLLDMLLYGSIPALYNEDGIDHGALEALLQAAEAIARSTGLENPENWQQTAASGFDPGNADYYSLEKYGWGEALAGCVYMQSFSYLASVTQRTVPVGETQAFEASAWVPMPGLVQGPFQPLLLAGVSSESENKTLAREFVACLLARDTQDHDLYDGLPVNTLAFALRAEYSAPGAPAYPDTVVLYAPPEYDDILETLATPVYKNSFLTETIKQHATAWLTGNATLEQALAAIEDATSMYFAELA